MLVDENFFDNLMRQTNIYAAQSLCESAKKPASNLKKLSHQRPWCEVDKVEIMKFFLLTLLMGLDPKPRFFQFWSRKEYLHCSFYGATMSCDQSVQILQFLHVFHNRNQNLVMLQDPLWKVRPFVDTLSSQFKAFYYPGKELSLDKDTCLFKGSSKLCFYNPNKLHKRGHETVPDM